MLPPNLRNEVFILVEVIIDDIQSRFLPFPLLNNIQNLDNRQTLLNLILNIVDLGFEIGIFECLQL